MRKLTMGVMALLASSALVSSTAAWAQDSVGAPPEQTHFKVSTYKPAVHDAATAKGL
jgi:alpha-L-fucosidase